MSNKKGILILVWLNVLVMMTSALWSWPLTPVCRTSRARQTAAGWTTAPRTASSGHFPETAPWAAAASTVAPVTLTRPSSTSRRPVSPATFLQLPPRQGSTQGNKTLFLFSHLTCIHLCLFVYIFSLSISLSVSGALPSFFSLHHRVCGFGQSGHDLLPEQPSADTFYDSGVPKCTVQVSHTSL